MRWPGATRRSCRRRPAPRATSSRCTRPRRLAGDRHRHGGDARGAQARSRPRACAGHWRGPRTPISCCGWSMPPRRAGTSPPDIAAQSRACISRVLNKIDLAPNAGCRAPMRVALSAKTGEGIDRALVAALTAAARAAWPAASLPPLTRARHRAELEAARKRLAALPASRAASARDQGRGASPRRPPSRPAHRPGRRRGRARRHLRRVLHRQIIRRYAQREMFT